MRRLKALLEKRLGLSWADITEWLREQNSVEEIERRLATGQWGELVQGVDAAGKKLADDLHQAYVVAGQTQAEWLDRQERLADTLARFDTGQAAVVDRQRQSEVKLVGAITEESRTVVRQILVDGRLAGEHPRDMARRLAPVVRDSIGLTPSQEKWVSNYRRALEQGDYARALGYELSSGNADRTVQSAQSRGKALSPARISEMVDAYRRNAIAYRAETIARTEAQGAAEAGAQDALRQAVDRGNVKAEELIVMWHAGPGTADAREMHQAMDEKTVRFGEDFILPDGTAMRGPHDSRGGARHNASCRCTSSTTIDLDRAPEIDLDVPAAAPVPVPAATVEEPPAQPKNPRRVAAARLAAAASVERRREIHSAARSNLPPELHVVWDKEGHKFMREEAARIRGVKDRVNASSTLSQAFAEKYGSGAETAFGNEGDRYFRRAELEAEHAISWADEQERKYYAEAEAAAARGELNDDDDVPF